MVQVVVIPADMTAYGEAQIAAGRVAGRQSSRRFLSPYGVGRCATYQGDGKEVGLRGGGLSEGSKAEGQRYVVVSPKLCSADRC